MVINPNPLLTGVRELELENGDSVELEESWEPTLVTLTPARAIRFMFTAIAWTPLQRSTIAIAVRPRLDLAPTLIIPPPR